MDPRLSDIWNNNIMFVKHYFHQIKIITKTKNYDESVKINHNPNWPCIPVHPYEILIIGGS